MEGYVVSNAVVGALVAGAAYTVRAVRRSRQWSQAFRELGRRRPIALCAIAFYVALGLADSVAWIDASATGIAAYEPSSLVDRLFPAEFQERSYSAPFAFEEFYGGAGLRHPGQHWLGTDIRGRDVLHMALKGARVALLLGGLTSLIVIPLALFFGMSAGYFGGRIDEAVFFAISLLSSIPTLLLLIALIVALGRGPVQVCFAMGVTSWVGFSRVIRGETLKLRELDYVAAARALGASDARILLRHILPNVMHLVVITFVLLFSGMVLTEAVLAFLGIGLDGSWGQMIDQARDELARDPIVYWNILAAFAALFFLILSVNRVGDAIRDILDPRTVRENV